MKKTIILLIILGFAKLGFSQWYTNGATWYFDNEYLTYNNSAHGYVKFEVIGDTLIDSVNAKIIVKSGLNCDSTPVPVDTIIVYANNNRAYYWTGYDFKLMYDFNLEVGDTLDIEIYQTFNCDSVSPMILDSIDTIIADSVPLRVQYLSFITWEGGTPRKKDYQIIEFVGYTYTYEHFIFPPLYCEEGDNFSNTSLRCFINENFEYKKIPEQWPCDTIINNLSVNLVKITGNAVSLYPNPATEYINVKIKQNNLTIEQIKIINSLGKVILKKDVAKNKISIDIKDFSPGIYNATLMLDNGQVINNKFIKIR